MANIEDKYTGDGATRKFNITFEYLRESDVQATLNNVPTTAFSFANATTLEFAVAPANGVEVRILRETATDELITTFFPGSAIRAQDLNDNANQVLFVGQEVKGRTFVTTGGTITGDLVMDNCDIVFEGSTDDTNETTLTVVDPSADRTITLPDQSGTVPLLANASNTQITATPEDLNVLDDVVAGTVSAGDGVVVDANKDINGFRNVTLTGELDANTLDISGNADIDGITNLDVVDIDENVDIAGDVTFSAAKDIKIVDNNAAALEVSEGTVNYLKFVTTNGSEKIETNKTLDIKNGWQINGSALNTTLTAGELNQLDGNTLKASGTTWDQTTEFPSANEIEGRINSKIAPLGGFEAIDDDESFPEEQPASGVIISIADAGGLIVDANGQSINGDTITSNTQVTIDRFPPQLRSDTVQDGIGLMVVSTGANQTYNFHRVIATDADVVQLSDDINDFNNRYRPARDADYTADNDVGDIYFNTTSNRLRVCTDAAGNGTFDDGVVVDAVRTTGATGAGKFPVGTTAQRPTDANMEGYFRYNSSTDQYEGHDGTDWFPFGRVETPNRNVLYNGEMEVQQRFKADVGITTTSQAGSGPWIDQFPVSGGNFVTMAFQQQQSTNVPTAAGNPRFANSLFLNCTTGEGNNIPANATVNIYYRVEARDMNRFAFGTSNAKPMTLSFWVNTSVAGTYALSFYREDSQRSYTTTYDIAAGDVGVWKKIIKTLPADTTGTIPQDAGNGLQIQWVLVSGSDFTGTTKPLNSWGAYVASDLFRGHTALWGANTNDGFLLTGVQLEVGETATPFEHVPYETQLRRCQRYYEEILLLGGNLTQHVYLTGFGGNSATWRFEHLVTKSKTPTYLIRGNSSIQAYWSSGWFNTSVNANPWFNMPTFVAPQILQTVSGYGHLVRKTTLGSCYLTLEAYT